MAMLIINNERADIRTNELVAATAVNEADFDYPSRTGVIVCDYEEIEVSP